MAWFARAPALDVTPPFAALLPHSLLLDAEAGILLLATPRWRRPGLALGCAWAIEPRNIEVCDETVCLEIARLHESLLRSLPVGGALQGLLTIRPTHTAPAWETLRQSVQETPVVQAQQAALRAGLRHQDGMVASRLRTCTTRLTLRLPVMGLDPTIPVRLRTLLALGASAPLTLVIQHHFTAAVARLEGVCAGIEDALRAAGHTVTRQTGTALGTDLFHALHPLADEVPPILPEVPLAEQVLLTDAQRVPGGWTFGTSGDAPLAAQVLSLHRAPPQTYPGLLSAPRAPDGTRALALVGRLAGVSGDHRRQYRRRRSGDRARPPAPKAHPGASARPQRVWRDLARTCGAQRRTGSPAAAVFPERRPAPVGPRACGGLGTRGRRWRAPARTSSAPGAAWSWSLSPNPRSARRCFCRRLPLGFDPAWPEERVLRRARRLPGANLAQLLPLYGAFRGTATPAMLFLNRRGEAVGFDPFDSATAPHALVMGTSGSGKSFAMAHLVQQVLPLGASVVILDRLPSYETLCAAWDGHVPGHGF